MARPIWTGAITFGLVTVPVKLYSAIDRKTVRFHQLSGKTGARVVQKRVDSSSGEEVQYADLVKGFEVAPEQYVVIESGDIDSIAPKKTKTIEIEDFVDLSQIDPVFYDQPYYLAPAVGGAKPYRLLLEAMRETGKVAIARVVIRSKEQLVALRPIGDALGMATMIFADEVLPAERLDELSELSQVKTTKRELDIAKQLVDSLAGDFEPAKYHDAYRQELLSMIERKAEGKEIVAEPAREEKATSTPDLMGALKASLEEVRSRTAAAPAKAKRAPAGTKAPTKKPAAPGTSRKAGAPRAKAAKR